MGKPRQGFGETDRFISESLKKAVSRESILGEIMLGYRERTDKQYISSDYKNRKRSIYRDSSRHLRYCDKCKMVWEHQYGIIRSVRSKIKVIRYIDFPTYKLARKHCPLC